MRGRAAPTPLDEIGPAYHSWSRQASAPRTPAPSGISQ